MTKFRTRGRFSFRFGPPFQLFPFCGSLVLGDLAAGPKIAKRFVSAGFASGGVFGPPSLVPFKTMAFKTLRKSFASKKRCKILYLEPCFGPFLAHRFSGWVFLRCGARFWAPPTRGKVPFFGPRGSGPKIAACAFFVAFSLRCRASSRRNFPLSLRFREVARRKCRYTRQGFTLVAPQPPGNCGNKGFLAWGGGCLMIYPNFAEKNGR